MFTQTKYKIRILRAGSRPTDKRPGMGLPAFELCKSDHFITSFYSFAVSTDETFINFSESGITSHYLFFYNPIMPKRRIGLKFLWLQLIRLVAITWYYLQFLVKARNEDPDIVHIHNPMLIGLALWGKLKGIKTCLTIHGTDIIRLAESRLLRSMISIIDCILCVSYEQQVKLIEWFPNKSIELVSNGVDFHYFSESTIPHEKRDSCIISVGTLRWHKNFITLINAFGQLADQYPKWKLIIIGEGPERHTLTKQIEHLGQVKRINLPGAVSREVLREQLGRASVFVMASVTEGLPKVLLEGMAAGCACIATNVGDCSRVLNDNGIIVNVNDVVGLSNALENYINNRELRVQKGSDAQKRVQDFSWTAYRDKHRLVYRNLLDELAI